LLRNFKFRRNRPRLRRIGTDTSHSISAQIRLIRDHLAEERDNFARGDFDDPAAIHGHDMEGVAELRARYAAVDVHYAERPDGAELVYTTDDPELVDAIHAWFDRQLMDHGADAEAG